KAAAVFEELLQRRRGYSPGWRRHLYLALLGAPARLTTSLEPLARLDSFFVPGDDPSERPHPDTSSSALPADTMSTLDRWRGGYDAVVAWWREEDDHDVETMAQLAASWPGRAVAVVNHHPDAGSGAVISRLQGMGLRVVPVSRGASWAKTAQRVV